MGHVSGTSSLISRLVGDLPRHELIGVVVGWGCMGEDPAAKILSDICVACVANDGLAHVWS